MRLVVLLSALALVAAACGGDDAEGVDDSVSCEFADLNLVTAGTLTVATGDPAFPPWIGVGDDNFDVPESKTGFEGGLVYALAAEMGFSDDQVVWVRTGFEEVITAGPKDWDFNIQQYSITEARDEVVDFSVPYYVTRQALVTFEGSPYATASSIEDLKDAKLGVALGTTSFDFVEDVIKPDSEVAVYDENVDVEAAMNADQLDGMVVDLPAAYYMTAVQIKNGVIAGQFEEGAAAPDEYGMLFAEGNPLVSCVNAALNTLIDDGTVKDLEDKWLTQDGGVPTITGG
jgi:polar amino acid transport system substrate-binding protein